MNLKTKMKIFISLFIVIILSVYQGASLLATAEEGTADNIQEVIDLLAKLPADAESVTADDVDFVLEAKSKYDALSAEEKLDVPIDSIALLNQIQPAVMPFLLDRITTAIKELPEAKKLKAENKEQVVSTYESYLALDDEIKEAISEKHIDTLLAAVEKVAPELLGGEAKEEQSSGETEKSNINFMKIWQIVLIIFVSVFVLCGLVVMILLIIRFIKLGDAH